MKTPRSICGVPVVDYVRVKGTGIILPVIESQTDIRWVEDCIRDREQHPEKYPDEDIPAVIARQKKLLKELYEKEKTGTAAAMVG